MLKKSFVLATLLVSTTFGAALPDTASDGAVAAASSAAQPEPSAESLALNWIRKLESRISSALDLAILEAPDSKERAISELTCVVKIMRSTPTITIFSPSFTSNLGHKLLKLNATNLAIDVFKLLLHPKVNRNCTMVLVAQACFYLHKLGETDLATSALREMIMDKSILAHSRYNALPFFYSINEDAHRAEAREMRAQLLVEKGTYTTLDEAREFANLFFRSKTEKAAIEASRAAASAAAEAATQSGMAGSDSDYDDMPPLERAE